MSQENEKFIPEPFGTNEKKQHVLENSSILKAFLADSADFSTWVDLQIKETSPMLNDFTEKLGDNWAFFAVTPLISLSLMNQVFNESYSDPAALNKYINLTTAELIFIGYEIGDDPILADFADDLLNKISSFPFIKPDIHDEQDTGLGQYLMLSLHTGNMIKKRFGDELMKKLPEQQKASSTPAAWDPQAFRHALDDVDMTGI